MITSQYSNRANAKSSQSRNCTSTEIVQLLYTKGLEDDYWAMEENGKDYEVDKEIE